MTKILWIITVVSLAVMIISMAVMGVKIFSGNFEILAEAYAFYISFAACTVSNLLRAFLKSKCPHCGKILLVKGKYCYKCGKELS